MYISTICRGCITTKEEQKYFMARRKGFFKDHGTDLGMVAKPKFAVSKSRESLSGKDKKDLVRVLGNFDPGDSLFKLHARLARSRRFNKSQPPEQGAIMIVSNSGYSGHHDKQSLREICGV